MNTNEGYCPQVAMRFAFLLSRLFAKSNRTRYNVIIDSFIEKSRLMKTFSDYAGSMIDLQAVRLMRNARLRFSARRIFPDALPTFVFPRLRHCWLIRLPTWTHESLYDFFLNCMFTCLHLEYREGRWWSGSALVGLVNEYLGVG